MGSEMCIRDRIEDAMDTIPNVPQSPLEEEVNDHYCYGLIGLDGRIGAISRFDSGVAINNFLFIITIDKIEDAMDTVPNVPQSPLEEEVNDHDCRTGRQDRSYPSL